MDTPPAPARRRAGSAIGWILTIPGFVMMGSLLLLFAGAMDRCGESGCHDGPYNGLFDPLLWYLAGIAYISYIASMGLVGLVPMIYSLVYPIRYIVRRVSAA